MATLRTAYRWFNPENIRLRVMDEHSGCAVADSWQLAAPIFYVNPEMEPKERAAHVIYCLLHLTDKYRMMPRSEEELLFEKSKRIAQKEFIYERIERMIAEAQRQTINQ